jgi:hypothetical protein
MEESKMNVTSAEANKMLRKLNDERTALLDKEMQNRVFVAATVENLEDARPAYSYAETQEKLAALDEQIRKLKHAINRFNLTQELPGLGMTIDQALIYIPQLTERKQRLSTLRLIPAKQRNNVTRTGNLIEYTYANFDPAQADADYAAAADELARVQNALDLVNSTVTFEVEI